MADSPSSEPLMEPERPSGTPQRFAMPDALGLGDRMVYALLVYLLPAAVLLLSFFALWQWQSQETQAPEVPLVFRAVADVQDRWSPDQALAALEGSSARLQLGTQLAQHPFWLRVDFPADSPLPATLEFPSRHATRLACWVAGKPLGQIDRQRSEGALHWLRAGFAVKLPATVAGGSLLCRAESIGPAVLTVLARTPDEQQSAAERFSREAGWLDGGLLALGLFLFVTALINRNGDYVLFAVWMLLNLRMASLSAGTDLQWLGQRVPGEWLPPMRLLTLALYFCSTYGLFRCFFREQLPQRSLGLQLLAWSCPVLIALALWMPFARYLPLIWAWTGASVLLVTVYLARILWTTRSEVAMWFAGSFAITLFASMAEVMAAALQLRGLTEVVNSVTAALSSGLLAALAMAAQMKQERNHRLLAQQRLQANFEAMPIGLFSVDLQGRFTQANPALLGMLGAAPGATNAGRWAEYFDDQSWQQLKQRLDQNAVAQLELDGPAGHRLQVRATRSGQLVEGMLQDITEQTQYTEKLRFLALNDPLTKVLNRRGVETVLAELKQALTPGRRLAMAYLDLDRFKLINDLYGHSAGDEVLQQVCERVQGLLSNGMRLGRVGGDEFVLLLPGVSLELACLVARGVLTAIGAQPYRVGDRAFQVRGSMGLVEIEADTAFKDAMARADRACREAKGHHSDGLVVFEHDTERLEEMEAEIRLVARLASNGEVEGMFLEMQPIMSLRQPLGSLNFEVLLRMRDPSGKLVPTPRLINAAERSGRMSHIDRWVMTQTLDWLQANRAQLASTHFVCINLSGASLNDERFVQDAVELLQQYPEVSPLLCLEITESVALHDLSNTQRFIHQVRQCGARVALDDFGAGYTSFSYLKDLPGDLLKIDGSFIVDMNRHPANVAIVEAIVSLARNLGMKTIAEWAEDAATIETLAEIGVDYVQGFAIARAQPPQALLSMRSAADLVQAAETQAVVHRLQQQGTQPELLVGFATGTPSRAA
jgi:diguanylate cyclase (GGDEF)-like protein